MKDIMQKLAELEATAPKTSKKKMLNEDSTTPPMNVSNKSASLKDVFKELSENVISGQKPLPVLDPQNKQAGMGFVTSNNPAVQNMLKNLDPKDVQIVQAPGQPGQPQVGQQQQQQTGQPAPAGATGQPQVGQMQMKEKESAEQKYEMRFTNGKTQRFVAATPEEAKKKARGLGASSLIKVNKDGVPKGKLEEEPVDESALQAYLGDKKYGKDGMDALRKAGREHAGKEKMANIRAKYDKMDEGDIPSSRGVDTMGAGLGAGRSQTTLEAKKGVNPFAKKDDKAKTKAPAKGKKPDFLDLDKDGDKKEPMKKAVADKNKKKVKESMNHKISAARHEGKTHGLRGHAHHGKAYEDLEEMRAYHEGYKEGLDECYGQGVYETAPAMPAATVSGMARGAVPAMEDEMEEGNAFTGALAKTPKGGKFSVGGKTFTDRSNIGEYAFESLDQQLNALLNESEEVTEGLSVSISKGQENSPDSVTITAQDAEAEHLLAFVKNAGLGLFGDDNVDTHSSAMSVQPSHGAPDEVGAGGVDIGVVDGHDGMMGLMQKLSGVEASGSEDYADEEGDEEHLYGNHEQTDKKDCGCDGGDCGCDDYDQPTNEETCNECGSMMEAGHSCGSKEMVDEVETEDQMEFEVAEDNAPDSGEAESTADEDAEAKEDSALAGADSGNEEEMNESDDEDFFHNPRVSADKQLKAPPKEIKVDENEDKEEDESVSESFANLFRKLAFIAEESTEKEDDKAEKAGEKVTKDIEHDDKEDKKGMSDKQAKFFGKKADKEKVDEWANQVGSGPGKGTDASFEADIDFMTKVISGGLNKQKSTGQTTIPVIAGQTDRMGVTKEAVNESVSDWAKLAGIK